MEGNAFYINTKVNKTKKCSNNEKTIAKKYKKIYNKNNYIQIQAEEGC